MKYLVNSKAFSMKWKRKKTTLLFNKHQASVSGPSQAIGGYKCEKK
jgi:hypothetical protein